MKKPPPYSYDLAILINPQWAQWDCGFPWSCNGGLVNLGQPSCNNEPIWWHPFLIEISRTNAYCEHCVTQRDRKLITGLWIETKAYLVIKNILDNSKLNSVFVKLGIKESDKTNVSYLVGTIVFGFFAFKELLTKEGFREFKSWIKKI